MRLFLLLLVFCCGVLRANEIDQLKTFEDINDFLHRIDSTTADFSVNAYHRLFYFNQDSTLVLRADSLHAKPWDKADFNNDGQTDLVVTGMESHFILTLVILTKGEKFTIRTLSPGFFSDPLFPVLGKAGNQNCIIVHRTSFQSKKYPPQLRTDTLIYLWGGFVEYNAHPANHQITEIKYTTSFCFGECPVFSLSINPSRQAKYVAEHYNYPDGSFTGRIDTAHYNEIIALLNYIDFASLDSNYTVNWTDDQTSTLTITYDGRHTKQIVDYGEIGTYGLALLNEKFFLLRKNQEWQK